MWQVWSQLKLEPTAPQAVQHNGVVRIAIGHSDDGGSNAERSRHRILNNVPNADLQPPESMVNIKVRSVRFSMDILEVKQRLQLRRSGTSSTERGACSTRNKEAIEQIGKFGTLSNEVTPGDRDGKLESSTQLSSSRSTSPGKKRKRSSSHSPSRTNCLTTLPTINGTKPCGWHPTSSEPPLTGLNIATKEQLAEIRTLIDTAMRLSVYGVVKSSGGIKIKANTFAVGLADVAPALWKPGFLAACKSIYEAILKLTRS
jgi:hypothetical protein